MSKLFRKSCLYYIILTLTKFKYFMSYNKVALFSRRRSDWGIRKRHQRIFRKVWNIYISLYRKCWSKDEFFMNLTELRLDLLFTDFPQHFGIYFVVFTLNFFIHGNGWSGKSWLKVKSFVSETQKPCNHNPNEISKT